VTSWHTRDSAKPKRAYKNLAIQTTNSLYSVTIYLEILSYLVYYEPWGLVHVALLEKLLQNLYLAILTI
jgi:hypothetical protein